MTGKQLQIQYDGIYSYFRTTTEPFDFLEWDGQILQVWCDSSTVEVYNRRDLKACKIIFEPEKITLLPPGM